MPYPSIRLITPQIPSPAPSAVTSVCNTSTAELKKAIVLLKTKNADYIYSVRIARPKHRKHRNRRHLTALLVILLYHVNLSGSCVVKTKKSDCIFQMQIALSYISSIFSCNYSLSGRPYPHACSFPPVSAHALSPASVVSSAAISASPTSISWTSTTSSLLRVSRLLTYFSISNASFSL